VLPADFVDDGGAIVEFERESRGFDREASGHFLAVEAADILHDAVHAGAVIGQRGLIGGVEVNDPEEGSIVRLALMEGGDAGAGRFHDRMGITGMDEGSGGKGKCRAGSKEVGKDTSLHERRGSCYFKR
jgi:hypothetical protein